jgi:hypothetical protein
MGVGGQRHTPAALPLEKTQYPLYSTLGALGPVWTGTENLTSTGIRSPDCRAKSESLYRLSYPHLTRFIIYEQFNEIMWSNIYDKLGCYAMYFGRQVSISRGSLLSQHSLLFYSES